MTFRGAHTIVVYGRRSVMEALECADVSVERVAFARDLPGEFRQELTAACAKLGVEPRKMTADEVAALSGDRRNDQGVAALISLKQVIELEAFVESTKGRGAARPTRLMALDGVTNPQNVGMIVRSVLASGMSGLVWPTIGSPWVNGLVIKSSAATVYRCPIVPCGALTEGLMEFQRAGFRVIGLDARGPQVTSLFDHAPPHRVIYVVGSEAEGISQGVGELLDERIAIPMANAVESLNAAVAAAIVAFSVSQRG